MPNENRRVDLAGPSTVLHEYLTTALCEQAWGEVRSDERNRDLSLPLMAEFWSAVILRAPPSLTSALEEAQRQAAGPTPPGGYPRITTSKQAFFARCQDLSSEFFQGVFERFLAAVDAHEKPRFEVGLEAVFRRYPGGILALDGSSLDRVARRMRVLRRDRRVPMPGFLLAAFDVCRGRLARLHHFRDLHHQELPRAHDVLPLMPKGALLVADRLYAVPSYLDAANRAGLFYVTRVLKRVNLIKGPLLRERTGKEGRIREWECEYGTSKNTPTQKVRLIQIQRGSRVFELITNVFDEDQLSAAEALAVYKARWRVERLFLELKEVLNLHRFYAANINAISMQIYAAAITHTALRVAQARIAHAVGVRPEALSTERLFIKLAVASSSIVIAEITFQGVEQANPEVRLKKPDWANLRFGWIYLREILIPDREPRRPSRRIEPDGRSLRRLPAPRKRGSLS
jgi:hypothetical protein